MRILSILSGPVKRLVVAGSVWFLFAAIWVSIGLLPAQTCSAGTDDIVIAKVNGTPITKAQLQGLIAEYCRQSGKPVPTAADREQLLKNLITRELLLQQNSVQALKKNATVIKETQQYENRLIIGRFLEQKIAEKIHVSDAEIEQYYQKHQADFTSRAKVQARHILLRNREQAEKVLKLLHQGGDFSKLAEEYSIDLPMALKGGSMGTITEGDTLPALNKVLFTLAVGEVSGIVHTKFGYHILTVDKIIVPQVTPLEKVHGKIEQLLARQERAKVFEQFAAKLRENANIQIFQNQLSKVMQ